MTLPSTTSPLSMQTGDRQTQEPAVAALLNKHPDIRARLTSLQHLSARLTGRWQGGVQAFEDARTSYDGAHAALTVARNDVFDGGPQSAVTAAVAEEESAKAALLEADKTAYAASQAAAVTRDALNPVITLLNDAAAHRKPLTFIKGPAPKGRADEVVAAQRKTIDQLLDERKTVHAAYPPRELAEAELLAQLDAMAKPPMVSIGRANANLRMPMETVRAAPLADTEMPSVTDAAGLFAWAHRDLIAKHITDELDVRYANGRLALSGQDKRKRLANIDAKVLAAEHVEVAAIVQAASEGIDIPLRKGTSPEALLGVEVGAAPPRPADVAGSLAGYRA